ncbi:MAG: InlB B-repeat-containing protein [Actinomycetales bacterium]|nr:InlB B-repeat-containing protein [Actinomycetales bacterium]
MQQSYTQRLRRFAALVGILVITITGFNLSPLRATAAVITPTTNSCPTDSYCFADFKTVQSGGTWSIPANVYSIDVLAIGGGGGGTRGKCSYVWGQGGGGGGFAEVTGQAVTPGATVTVAVGGGGTGSGECNTSTQGTQGGTSSVVVGSVAIYAYGGYAPNSGTGYSTNVGGNSGNNQINGVNSSGTAGGAPTYDSTGNCTGATSCGAGGGGGAGAAGSGLNAGTGRVSTLTGVRYAGGGGGRGSSTYGTADANSGYSGRCDGPANYGGGGADCNAQTSGRGGNGGSGYVYIRYLPGPTITNANQTTTLGSTATFTATPTRASNLTAATFSYQWQSSTDSGTTWADIAGATSATYTTPTQNSTATSAIRYRAKVTQTATTIAGSPTAYNYSPAATLTVNLTPNIITFGALSGKTYGDASFNLAATASSGLTVAFTSATTGVCTVSGTTVTIVSAGTCTINANQAGNATYAAATQVQQSFTVSAKALTITATNDTKIYGATKTYGASSSAFTQSGLVGSETIGSVTITASGGTTTTANIGTYSLTPSAATGGTFVASNYTITYVAGSLTVSSQAPVFSWANASTTYAPSGTYSVTAPTVTTGGTGTWSYSSSDTTVATVATGNTLNLLKAGSTTITATFSPSSSNYTGGTTTTMVLTVNQAANTITWTQTLGNVAFGSTTIALTATASNGGSIAYSTNNNAICSVSGSTLTITGAGSCTVTANQAGDVSFAAATAATKTFSVTQAANAITFAPAPTGLTYGETGQTRTVSASVASGTIAYSTSSPACTVDSNTGVVTIVTAGSCVITATASSVSANYQTPTSQNQTLTIATASSTPGALSNATATYAPSATFTFTAPAVTSAAVSGSVAGTWAFASSDSTVAALSSGTTFNILKPGTVTITGAFTPTDSSIASSTQTFTLTIGQGNNVISFAGIAARTVTSGNFTVSATASSALAITITSATTSVCTISNGTVTLVGIGTCTLNANQAGNTNYAAAAQVAQSFGVSAVTVTLDSNNGSSSTRTQSISSANGANLPANNFTRTGYTFIGWSTSAAGSVTHSDSQSVAFPADTTLFAVWSANNYGITYFANGANSGAVPVDSTNYNIGQSITIRSNTGSLDRTGYSFAGWNTAANGSGLTFNSGNTVVMGASSVSLFALWTPNTYTITYNANGATGSAQRGGNAVATDSYTTAGTDVTLPSAGTLTKTGFTFSGWADAPTGTVISGTFTTTANITLYAQWTIMVINATYDKGSASASTFVAFPSNTSGNYATRITLSGALDNQVTIGGLAHVFVGWSDGTSIYRAGDQYLLGVSNVTLTAQWVQVFGVRYSFGGGTPAGSDTVVDTECLLAGALCTNQQSITAHLAPSRAGYTFGGWVDQSGNSIAAGSAFTVSTGTYLLYATWLPINYTISYLSNGSSATVPTQAALHYGDTFAIGSAIARTGYDFAGWSDGSFTYGAGAQYSVGLSNISFTAVWVPHVYSVGFDWNGGSGTAIANRSYTVGTTGIALPGITNQVRDGYVFAGWSLTQNGTVLASPYVPTGTGTLYAVWSTGSYTLNFDSQLGTVAQASASVANGASQTLPTPTRANFVFLGWFTAATGGTLAGQAGASYTPSASTTLYARWVQSSLYGIAPGNLTRIGTINALQLVGSNYSGTSGSSSVSVTVPAGALPSGTVVGIDLIADNSYAQSLISGSNTYVLSVAVSWLASDGTVPNTNTGKAVTLTITNASIRAGALVYSIQNGIATLLGTATANGTVTVELTSDPGIYLVQTVSSAPRTLNGLAGRNSIVFTWSAPTTDGGSAITGYTITLNDGSTCSTTGALTCTISNLTEGTRYTAQLTATNGVGTSVAATASVLTTSPVIVPPVVVVPKKAPGAPITVFVGNSGNKITVNWSAPTDNGGAEIIKYLVSSNFDLSCETTARSCTFTGQPGVVYVFSIVAVNEVGTSPAELSREFELPAIAPAKPVVVQVPATTAVITVNPTSGVPVLAGVTIAGAIRFNADSAKLDAVDRAAIAAAAKAVQGKPGVLLITGFVKASGASKATQQKLATARAKAVAAALATLGVKVKLGYLGFGAANRLNPTSNDRKVEIRWVPTK